MELPEFRECVAAVKHGMSWADAVELHPLERRAFIYCAAEMDGGKINWDTGEVKFDQPKVK